MWLKNVGRSTMRWADDIVKTKGCKCIILAQSCLAQQRWVCLFKTHFARHPIVLVTLGHKDGKSEVRVFLPFRAEHSNVSITALRPR